MTHPLTYTGIGVDALLDARQRGAAGRAVVDADAHVRAVRTEYLHVADCHVDADWRRRFEPERTFSLSSLTGRMADEDGAEEQGNAHEGVAHQWLRRGGSPAVRLRRPANRLSESVRPAPSRGRRSETRRACSSAWRCRPRTHGEPRDT